VAPHTPSYFSTLPNDYFEFKRVWECMPHEQRTVKALPEELCLLEQRLKQRDGHIAQSTTTNVALLAKQDSTRASVCTKQVGYQLIRQKSFRQEGGTLF